MESMEDSDESNEPCSDFETENGKTKQLKRKKQKQSWSSDSNSDETLTVGMIAVSREDGLFSDPFKVAKVVHKKLGPVRSIRVTRSGMVVMECVSLQQRDEALKMNEFKKARVRCFPLDGKRRVKGVVGGIPLYMNVAVLLELKGVCEARRLKRVRNGEREESTTVCLTFDSDSVQLPTKVFLNYVAYTVRPFEKSPLRCFSCQSYGHVASVCKSLRKCARCGDSECRDEKECEAKQVVPKCVHCEGQHRVGSSVCPRYILEKEVKKLREKSKMSYVEAVETVKHRQEPQTPKTVRSESEKYMCVNLKCFLAFMVMVLNCSMEIQGKTERIHMIMDAAKRFLDLGDISEKDLHSTLQSGLAQGSESSK